MHDFRIDWTATSVTYWIDGTQVASHAIAITANMEPLMGDYSVGGGAVTVDWMRLTPYTNSGSYLSRVFDAGSTVTWLDAQWAASIPAGASVALSVRMGNTPTPDASWTDFVPMASSGATIGGSSRYAQYRVDLSTTNSGQTPVLQAVTLEYTNGPDSTPPTIVSESPAPNATGAGLLAPVVVKFSELMNAATITSATVRLRAVGASSDVAATVTFSGSTAVLQPTTALVSNTVYQVTVSGSVTDASGNALGSDVTWTFTTGTGQWVQTTTSDFATGFSTGIATTSAGGGGLQLGLVLSDDFTGTALSSAWTTTPSGGGQGGATVSGGILKVLATEVDSAQTFSNAPVEGLISFGASTYQHFGLATGLSAVSGNYWAIFSTAGTTNTLFARVNVNGATQDVNLGALPTGFHDYLVKPVSGGFQFWVDGVLRTTITASFPTGTLLKAVLYDYNGLAAAPLQADWVRVLSYVSSGSFISSTFDATRTATWGTASWTATLPPGTSILIETSSSNDGTTWSSWTSVSNGGTVASPPGRYLRYRVTLVTTDPTQTPTLSDILFNWT
jgi:hypothetical protein